MGKNNRKPDWCARIYETRSDRRDLLATKVNSEIFTEKERPSYCEHYRQFEEIIFRNNKDVSV